MFKPVHALVVVALALGSSMRLEATQLLWFAACEPEPHRDALTDAVDGVLNEGDPSLLELHSGPQGGGTATAPPAAAQDGQEPDKKSPYKWWLSPEGKKEFGISEPQSRELEAQFQQMLPTLRANKSELDKQEKTLNQLLGEAGSSEPTVAQAIDRAEAARSALSRTRTLMLYRMYRLLSPEQRAKVQAYYERKAQEADRTARR
jgi:Spy/CpxP family protein refolding chaperone